MPRKSGRTRLQSPVSALGLAAEEEIQHGPDHDDCRKLADVIPCRRDHGANNVSGQLEFNCAR